jgi:hypothetical protein
MTHFYSPLLGTARVYAYARNQGHDVRLKDFNQDSYFTLLSRPYLEQTLERVQYSIDSVSRNTFMREDLGSILLHSSGNALRQLTAKGMLLHLPWHKYLRGPGLGRLLLGMVSSKIKPGNLLYALLSEKDFVLTEIEKSRKAIDEGFYSLPPADFISNFYGLLCGKALIDAAYFPAQLDFGLGFYGSAFAPRVSDVLRAVEDERYNFLIPYYTKRVLPMLQEEHPTLVGISLTFMSDLVPALTLAHTVKSFDPSIHVVAGGSLVTELQQRISRNLPLWRVFDSLVLGPGEVAFSELLQSIEKRDSLAGVPNVIYKDGDTIRKSEKVHNFDINEARTPEFALVRPKSSLPLETASNCYWGKCVFCYYPKGGTADLDGSHAKGRVRSIELVLKDIQELRDHYDPLFVGLTDSSVHPKRLEAIAEGNLRSAKKVKFSALFRLEKEFKSKALCRKLAEGGFLGGHVGLESASQRVNDIMNKGIELSDASEIIRNCHEVGLMLHIFTIVGMPGETDEEALMTYQFLKRQHRWLKLDFVVFPLYILEQSPLAQMAAELGVKLTPLPDDFLVQSMDYSSEGGTSQNKSMTTAIRFSEKLKPLMHPINRIMDVQSAGLFLLAQKAKGIRPERVKLNIS